MGSSWKMQDLLVTIMLVTAAFHIAQTAPPKRSAAPSSSLLPPSPPRHFRRQIQPSESLYAPAFLPTPLPPLENPEYQPREHKLKQPKKPVYHYTPIKPFTEEELGDVYRAKGKTSPPRDIKDIGYGFDGPINQLFESAVRDVSYGPQVHEYQADEPQAVQPIQPPTPIVQVPVSVEKAQIQQVPLPVPNVYNTGSLIPNTGSLIPDTELVDIKTIRLGEAVGLGDIGASVVQRQNPAHSKYHFEYRVRDHHGEFGHAEARDGSLVTGGYDVKLDKTHVQSIRYFVDSKEIPVYAQQYQHT